MEIETAFSRYPVKELLAAVDQNDARVDIGEKPISHRLVHYVVDRNTHIRVNWLPLCLRFRCRQVVLISYAKYLAISTSFRVPWKVRYRYTVVCLSSVPIFESSLGGTFSCRSLTSNSQTKTLAAYRTGPRDAM